MRQVTSRIDMRGSEIEFLERFGATEIAMTALFDGTEETNDMGKSCRE